MNETEWPTDDNGKPMKMGDMTPDQRREQIKKACVRVQSDFQRPEVQAGIAAVLSIDPVQS